MKAPKLPRISSNYIVNALLTEFGFTSINASDIYDYIGDAISLIGHGLHQDVLYTQAKIDFYKIHYPCNVTKLLNVYYDGKIVPRKSCRNDEENRPFGWLENEIINDVKLIQVRDSITALEDQSQEDVEDRELLLRDIIRSFDFIHKYKKVRIDRTKWIEPTENIISTNIEEGTVYIEHLGIAVDDEGVPMIYDEIHYLTALKYYCTFILIQSGVRHPVISYGDALSLKDTWIGKAKNYSKRLDSVTAHAFKSNWTNVLRGSSGKYKYRN